MTPVEALKQLARSFREAGIAPSRVTFSMTPDDKQRLMAHSPRRAETGQVLGATTLHVLAGFLVVGLPGESGVDALPWADMAEPPAGKA